MILWLHDKKLSVKQKNLIKKNASKFGVKLPVTTYRCMEKECGKPLYVKKPKTKNTWILADDARNAVMSRLNRIINVSKPKVIVINDKAVLEILFGYSSLHETRGSVYFYNNIPCVVMESPLVIIQSYSEKVEYDEETGVQKPPAHYQGWLYASMLAKVTRWHNGKPKTAPKFNYKLVESKEDLEQLLADSEDCICAAVDIETCRRMTAVFGMTLIMNDGRLISYVIPFIDARQKDWTYWRNPEDEVFAWEVIRAIMRNKKIHKAYQNGSYDITYQILEHCEPHNITVDTMHMLHSMYAELPKSLAFLAALTNDYYQYWKDEIKGDSADKDKQTRKDAVPTTTKGIHIYWQYNGVDTYQTAIVMLTLLDWLFAPSKEYAMRNYIDHEMSQQYGPALLMSMRGILRDKEIYNVKMKKLKDEVDQKQEELSLIVGEDFNPSSPKDVPELLYDVLDAEPIKIGRQSAGKTADKKSLKLIKTQSWILNTVINAITDFKEPLNNLSKYSKMEYLANRFNYALSIAGTGTGRYSGKGSNLWSGTNPQNVPGNMRDMFRADPGFFLADIDYSQSDAYFVAFESQDENYINNMLSDKDTHSLHAAFFFAQEYETIAEGAARKDPKYVDPQTGIRQVTKRVVHGANYQMAAFTLFMTLGVDAVKAAGAALGRPSNLWGMKEMVDFCGEMLLAYLDMYPRLGEWFDELVEEVAGNGKIFENPFGWSRYTFGSPRANKSVQRFITSLYGQSNTAGNINRTLREIVYDYDMERLEGIRLLLQVHDSILLQCPYENPNAIKKVLTIMEKEITIKDRTFVVPAEAEVGIYWSKDKGGMIPYEYGVTTIEDIKATAKVVRDKYGLGPARL